MNLEEVKLLGFQMISYAGDALDCFYKSIQEYKNGKDLSKSKDYFEEGKKHLNECHLIQTKLIQAESNGEEIPYSLIMTHAQDHFTSAITWQRFAQLMIIDQCED